MASGKTIEKCEKSPSGSAAPLRVPDSAARWQRDTHRAKFVFGVGISPRYGVILALRSSRGYPLLPEDDAPISLEHSLVMAIITAADADGDVGPEEHRMIFDQVSLIYLYADEKAFIFARLSAPPGLQDIASLASGPEQAAEIYLASRLAIDPDLPAELAYLEALASRLALPPDLVAHLETQAVQVA